MLIALHIEDYALIDRLEIEFGPGLNVLTGETGAGKSIVIDAVTSVLGGRATAEAVRQGKEKALIEAEFSLTSRSGAYALLEEMELLEGDALILSREIAPGRNRCRINGRLVNLSHLGRIGERLVDIHGQHDHQSLLSAARHLDLLDGMAPANLRELRRRVSELAGRRAAIRQEAERLREGERERERRLDLLRYQIDEIDAANLSAGEDELLAVERSRLAHAERLAEGVREAYALLYEGDGRAGGAVDLIGSAVRRLEALVGIDDRIASLYGMIEQAMIGLQEAARELRAYGEGLVADPGRLAEVEERIEAIARLKRKYGETIEAVLAFREEAAASLEATAGAEERLAQLERELAGVEAELASQAAALSEGRRRLAAEVAEAIEERLALLNMPAARFIVAFRTHEEPDGVLVGDRRLRMTERGIDDVEFLFSANPGEEPRPLAKIASGGEMSRVMLAVKAAMAEADALPTLIFDEVDAGIGGETAERVAEALAELSRTHQVLVVTHLAQVAAKADRHLVVEKRVSGERTTVSVRPLDDSERVLELARMLDGGATDSSFEHARALLRLARSGRSAR